MQSAKHPPPTTRIRLLEDLRAATIAEAVLGRIDVLTASVTGKSAKSNNLSVWVSDTVPTVHRFHGLRVVIYPNDYRPPHVHVMGKGCEAVFKLSGPHGPPELRENYGFTARDLAMFAAEIGAHLQHLQTKWSTIHGH